jgi:transposase-like protein
VDQVVRSTFETAIIERYRRRESSSVLVAIAVNRAGYREVLGVAEGAKEDKEGWSGFLRHLKKRGSERSSVVHLGQMPGVGGVFGRVLSISQMADLRGSFLP